MAEEVRTGLTTKALILGLIGCVATGIVHYERYTGFLGNDILDYWHQNFCGLGIIGGAFTWMLVIALINQGSAAGWWKFRFTRQEVAVIVTLAMLGGYLMEGGYQQIYEEWFDEGIWVARQSPADQVEYWAKFPDTLSFGPKNAEPYASLITEGSRTLYVDWGPFMPMIITGILWTGFAMLYYLFGSLLLRRLYTRVEYLSMPFTDVMTSFTELTQPASRKVNLFAQKAFLIAFVLSFLYHFAVKAYQPWVAVTTGTPVSEPWYGTANLYPAWDLTPNAWLPWSGVYVTFAPWEIGWALILPVNVLVTALITWLVVYVIFPFAYMGTYWGPFNESTMGSSNSAIRLVGFEWRLDDLGFSLPSIIIGMLLAAVFVPIILNWRQMAPIFKSLLGSEPSREFDPDRPLSYRMTWWLTIGFFVLWYLVGVALLQAKPDALLAFLVIMSIQFFGVGRVLSETGGWYGAFHLSPYYTHEGITSALAATHFTTLGDDVPSYVTAFMLGSRGHFYSWGDRCPFFDMHSFKLADNTRTRLNGFVKIMIIGIVIGVTVMALVHFTNRAYSTYIWKLRGEYIRQAVSNAARGRPQRNYDIWSGNTNEASLQIIFGFAVIFVLSFLQPRISFMRGLSVGGVIWGFNGMYLMWAPWIVALIVKYIVLRTGGTRMYTGTIKPFGLGLFAGGLISLFLSDVGAWLAWALYSISIGAPF